MSNHDQSLYSLLHIYKQLAGPQHIALEVRKGVSFGSGNVRQIEGPIVPIESDWKGFIEAAVKIGITKITLKVPEDYDGPVDLFHLLNDPTESLYYYAAPWFIVWLTNSSLTPDLIQSKAQRILQRFFSVEFGKIAYRGENKIYRSVSSTLSRHWNTNSTQALDSIISDQTWKLQHARKGSIVEQLTTLEIQIALQHLGGKTNLIDFSALPWIALYFACTGEPTKSGRLFALDVSTPTDEFRPHVVQDKSSIYPLAGDRLRNQLGILVEPKDGRLRQPPLELVETIEPNEKPIFSEWLKRLDIERSTLFADLVAYIEERDDELPDRAWMHMMAERLARGDAADVLRQANARLAVNDRDQIGLYYRGLASALLGNSGRAYRDLKALRDIFKNDASKVGPPEVLKRNLRLLSRCARGRVSRRNVRGKLDLTVDVAVGTVTLGTWIVAGTTDEVQISHTPK